MPGQTTPDAFDVVATYHRLLAEDPDLTMPVAAIESLIFGLANTPSTTVSETLDRVSKLTAQLKAGIANPISLSAGTDLFQQYLISNLQRPSARGDFDQIRTHLVQNGRLFVERAKAARETIASFGKHFIRDGNTVLTNGGSRVVGALLRNAAESSNGSGRGSIRFRVIYVTSPNSNKTDTEAAANIAALRDRDIPVAEILPTAIAYCMDTVTSCFVGAEGVVENGGIVSRLGTYQMAVLAKAAGKPFYVVSESHKFVRLYPLGQDDLGIEQDVVQFKTKRGVVKDENKHGDAGETTAGQVSSGAVVKGSESKVDYTPPAKISGIITEGGVLLPSAFVASLHAGSDLHLFCKAGRVHSFDSDNPQINQHQELKQRPLVSTNDPTMATTPVFAKSRLLALPAELRQQIYEYSLVQSDEIVVRLAIRRYWRPPALLQTCREIRHEATPTYYADNTFYIYAPQHAGCPSAYWLWDWLRCLPESTRTWLRTLQGGER
ncbi:translation initiation factor eIF-2B subunit alpha [Recurvomyces mirabilis]|uniref:Translation initiation factor eIF2B subunit alpha n=1 Tax=Recurvomyces mirabilis TaxID=574656 RepID=A0AAE0WUF8_9PEZI|nr:translation initiation factor eIF-2B subunit alpha [Recurvomyces mirabilis]KAK5160553.1 translation initiation factor eIF-2B subunit alpha [Recurvomyces mirabilis]